MRKKLICTALIALSVSALTAELCDAAVSYEPSDLAEAIEAEKAGANRVTAIEALENAVEAMAGEQSEEITAGVFVCKGKSITTKSGIKTAGDEVLEGDLPQSSIKVLLDKKYLEVVG